MEAKAFLPESRLLDPWWKDEEDKLRIWVSWPADTAGGGIFGKSTPVSEQLVRLDGSPNTGQAFEFCCFSFKQALVKVYLSNKTVPE